MRDRTVKNTFTITLLVNTVQLLLPNNPWRKSFMLSPIAAGNDGAISIGMEPKGQNALAANAGVLNYVVGATFPTLVDDDQIGSVIGDQWYVISLNGGEVIQVTEFSYAQGII